MTRTTLEEYCRRIADEVLSGKLVPFLGAGVNLCARPEGFHWSIQQSQYLPNGGELAKYLALKFRYPTSGPCPNPNCPRAALDFELAKVAQYRRNNEGMPRTCTTIFGSYSHPSILQLRSIAYSLRCPLCSSVRCQVRTTTCLLLRTMMISWNNRFWIFTVRLTFYHMKRKANLKGNSGTSRLTDFPSSSIDLMNGIPPLMAAQWF